MCGKSWKGRIRNEHIQENLGVATVALIPEKLRFIWDGIGWAY